MTLYQFKLLDEMEQIETVWSSVLLAIRNDGEFDYELYQIDAFYVELRYLKGGKAVSSLKTFANPDLLHPYLDKIDINSLKK
jgi:hypothetical protein